MDNQILAISLVILSVLAAFALIWALQVGRKAEEMYAASWNAVTNLEDAAKAAMRLATTDERVSSSMDTIASENLVTTKHPSVRAARQRAYEVMRNAEFETDQLRLQVAYARYERSAKAMIAIREKFGG